jgi:phage protein D
VPDTTTLLSQVYLQIDGAPAPPALMGSVLEVTVESSLHLPDVATIVLHDPRLQWIDAASLAPGKTLIVEARSGQRSQRLFDGEIVELEPDFRPTTQHLTVRAFDRLHRLTRGRRVRSYLNVSDGDIVQKIAQEVQLQANVGPTNQVHPYVLQNNETNLAFLRSRAAALGYLVYVRGSTLHFEPPQANGSPVQLEWGATMSEFRPRLTTMGQDEDVTVRGWDPSAKQEVVGRSQNGQGAPQIGESRPGGQVAHGAFNLASPHLVTEYPVRTQAAADRLAQAVADRMAGRFVEAEGVCLGNPAIIAGVSVELKSVGERFGGTYLVTAATHTYGAEAGYLTEFKVSGHHAATLLELLNPAPERALMQGLAIGIVTDNQDPEGQGRVKVKYPSLSGDHASDWARVAVPGGGKERGIEFLPEVNDEVLVGFELGDVHFPYVIGGLWNGQDAPPKKSGQVVSSGKVEQRIIRSRTGHFVTFDDEDGGGGITIEDRSGNKIVIDSGENSILVEVKGDATVKSQGNLTLDAKGQVEIKGMGVKVDGGAGTVDVKGSVINLN